MTDGSLKLNETARIFAVVHRDDLDLPLAPERDRFLPVDDLEGLVRRVQEKRLFHKPESFCPMDVPRRVKGMPRVTVML